MVNELPETTKKEIISLLQLGNMSHREIADKVGLGKWGHKTVSRYAKKIQEDKEDLQNLSNAHKTLDQMDRDERFDFLRSVFDKTPRALFVFKSLSDAECEFFTDEYLRILRSTDSITEPEEQQLFSACIEYVLAFRALQFKNLEEQMYQETMAGQWQRGDERYRTSVDDRYAKEYDQHMKIYQQMMKNLKMSREQRLDKIRSDKRTLTDLASELMDQSVQANAAEEIERLSKMSDEELKRLLDNGHIFGEFSD